MFRDLGIAICALLVAAPAAATEPRPDMNSVEFAESPVWQEKPNSVAVSLGYASPSGIAGVEGERMWTPWFATAIGAGWGQGGPQASGTLRLKLGWRPNAYFGLGLGGSYGGAKLTAFMDKKEIRGGYWGNAEIFHEIRQEWGFVFRANVGLGTLIRADECTRETTPWTNAAGVSGKCNTETPILSPYAGVQLGHAF